MPNTEPIRWDSGWLAKSEDTKPTRRRCPELRSTGCPGACWMGGMPSWVAVRAQCSAYLMLT